MTLEIVQNMPSSNSWTRHENAKNKKKRGVSKFAKRLLRLWRGKDNKSDDSNSNAATLSVSDFTEDDPRLGDSERTMSSVNTNTRCECPSSICQQIQQQPYQLAPMLCASSDNEDEDEDEMSVESCAVECMVCLEGIPEDQDYETLPCGHAFHTGCLNSWRLQNDSCPYCRCNLQFVGMSI